MEVGGNHKSLPLTEELVAVESFWGRWSQSVPFKDVAPVVGTTSVSVWATQTGKEDMNLGVEM